MVNIIAHRGASYLAHHDNSIEAFELAIELGADMVEFDVRKTRDGELIVYHDRNFADSPIGWQTFENIEREAYEKGIDIPTLDEVLKFCHGRIKMDIEVKEPGFEKELVKKINAVCDYDEYSVKSFHDKVIYKIKKLDKNIKTGLLIGKEKVTLRQKIFEYFPERRLVAAKADFVSPNYKLCTNGFILRMKRKHIPVYAWTINSTADMRKYIRRGVDAIITDKPDAGLFVRNTV